MMEGIWVREETAFSHIWVTCQRYKTANLMVEAAVHENEAYSEQFSTEKSMSTMLVSFTILCSYKISQGSWMIKISEWYGAILVLFCYG